MRKFLINILGGYTEKEYIEANRHSYNEGASEALLTLKLKADILYGKPADEWCKLMYEEICKHLGSLTDGTYEERPTAHP